MWVAALLGAQTPTQTPAARPAPISFANDILPIFEANCLTCHGAGMQLAKLDLRTRESALAGGAHGPAIVPGNAEQSRLFRRIAGAEAPAMPMTAIRSRRRRSPPSRPGSIRAPRGRPRPRRPRPRANPLAALERMDITPEQRNYWAFKLPVQAPCRWLLTRISPTRSIASSRRRASIARLKAAPRADRLTLVRRAYLDLIGLPPTPAEVAAFLADQTPSAWERLIDRLLASPHYGERWGRHWLDVARYADSGGFEHDCDRPNAWRYRDYVIKSFNDDKPYNVFLMEQIAGDELDWKTDETLIATGFLRAGPRVLFREKDNPERRYEYLDEMIATIGKGRAGADGATARAATTTSSIRFAQKDYYALQASLFGYVETTIRWRRAPKRRRTRRRSTRSTRKWPPLQRRDRRRSRRRTATRLAARADSHEVPGERPARGREAGTRADARRDSCSRSRSSKRSTCPARADRQGHDAGGARRRRSRLRQIACARQASGPRRCRWPRSSPTATTASRRTARATRRRLPEVQESAPLPGSFLHNGPGTVPGAAVVFPDSRRSREPRLADAAGIHRRHHLRQSADRDSAGRRPHVGPPAGAGASGSARRDNPLTARVIVNRIWHHHFGRGIVATLDNFGKMGEPPTHPELLDWLAVEFMNRGWSIKQMHRLIMTSEAYQMASAFDARGKRDEGSGEPLSVAVPRRSGSKRRSSATASWRRAAAST